MKEHTYENSNPDGFDSDCRKCGGKHRDSVHGPTDEIREDRLTLKKALLDLGREDYEKLRSELIRRLGYDKFRDLQNEIFAEIGTIKFEKSSQIALVPQDSFIYNVADADGHERADMGKGKPKGKRIYSAYRIENDIAHCQSKNAWGEVFNEQFRVETLQPYNA